MNCPKCGSYNIRVVDTIPHETARLFRRRKCNECHASFRTVETIDDGSADFKEGYSAAWAVKAAKKGRNT